jgi:hypothetical protein
MTPLPVRAAAVNSKKYIFQGGGNAGSDSIPPL